MIILFNKANIHECILCIHLELEWSFLFIHWFYWYKMQTCSESHLTWLFRKKVRQSQVMTLTFSEKMEKSKSWFLLFWEIKKVKVMTITFFIFRRKSAENGLSQIDFGLWDYLFNSSEYFSTFDFVFKNKIFKQK